MLEQHSWLFGACITDFAWDAIELTNVSVFCDDSIRFGGEPIFGTLLYKFSVAIVTATTRKCLTREHCNCEQGASESHLVFFYT